MICDCKNPIIKIIGVEHSVWKADSFEIEPRDYAALTFRVKGAATIKVDKKTHSISSGDVLYMPQGAAYTAEYDDTEILAIHFRTAKSDKDAQIYSLANTEKIYQAFLTARALWQSKDPGYEAYVLSQLYYILGKLCKNEMTDKIPEHFLSAVSFINTNYKDSTLTTQKICESAGLGATSLRQFFKKYYNKSPVEYITELRLEYARNLISCGEPISDAAEKSGFNDPKYFARGVKKHFGCTPRDLKTYGK